VVFFSSFLTSILVSQSLDLPQRLSNHPNKISYTQNIVSLVKLYEQMLSIIVMIVMSALRDMIIIVLGLANVLEGKILRLFIFS